VVRIDAALVLGSFELRSLHSALNDESYGRWIERVETIVRDGQERGAFGGVDAHEFVLRFLTMMDGLVIQVLMGSAEVDMRHMRDLLLGFARDGLRPDGPREPTR